MFDADRYGSSRRVCWLKKVALALAATVVTLALGELALRWLSPYGLFAAGRELHWKRESPRDLSGQYVIDPAFGFRPVLGARYSEYGTLKNEYELEKDPARQRLLFIGDSATARRRIDTALRNVYGSEGFEYWNAGVESFNTPQEVRYYEQFNRAIKPDHVILTFHNNDFETTPVAFYDDGKLVVFSPHGRLGRISRTLFEHCILYRIVLGAWFLGGKQDEEIAAEVRDSLARLRELTREDGIPLTVLLLPIMKPLDKWTPQEEKNHKQAREILDALRIRTFDLTAPMVEALKAGVEIQQIENDHWHPTHKVSRWFAEYLQREGLFTPKSHTR
ncbi:MAG: hypothetical protein V2A76_06180 [Planctomycetota bacterium]